MTEKEQEELQKIIEDKFAKELEKARMIGVNIGWQGFALSAIKQIEKMHSIKEVKEFFRKEANDTARKMNLVMNGEDEE